MTNPDHRRELQDGWETTTRHLVAARDVLSAAGLDESGSASVAIRDYEEFLNHNELELALDSLEVAVDQSHPPSEFWRHLLNAARNMGLAARAERIEKEIR
jgi:hypothetical protein